MDADYAAPGVTQEGGIPSCPKGMIRRIAHTKTVRGKTIRVASKCITDRGAKGRWKTVKRLLGIGPLKKGDLTALGYRANDSAEKRHESLDKAVKKYGKLSALRKLNAIAVYTKRTIPTRSKTYKTDRNYIKKKYF